MNTTLPDLAGPGAAAAPAASAPAPDLPPAFPRQPGETPRAFGAFLAFFQLGHGRSLAAVAGVLGENPATVKNWSSKYHWSDRVAAFQSGLLQAQVAAQTALQNQSAADWARRMREYRENEWAAGQKLHAAVLCYLENFGDREVEKMTLSQVSRALQISSRISRQALSGGHVPADPAPSAVESALAAALQKAYGPPATPAGEQGGGGTGQSPNNETPNPSP